MSNFLIFKAAFNNSATPAIGVYTAEGATALFTRNTNISPDYYLYNTADNTAAQWFVPTAETTDFEFVADILTRQWTNRVTYFIIADSAGTTRLRMWSQYANWFFENGDSIDSSGTEYIGVINPTTSGGFGVFHQFRVRVHKLTASSSSVEVYVDGTLKLTATAGAALITCAKIGLVGGVGTFGPGTAAGIKNAYVYDLSGGEVIDRGVLSGAFNRFISWAKGIFALKSDIPTVNNATLTIQRNGTNVATFTANQSTAATANITVPTAVSELTNDSGYLTASSNLDASKLTSGTVDIARLPQGALERLVKVANEAARYALTTADVQLGDTVQQLDTGIMYVVTDTDHLDSAAGYTEYTAGTAASVPWSGVTGKPTFAAVATSGAYSDLTGTPALAAVATSGAYSDLTGTPALAAVATSGAYSDLTGTPTIPTVNNATLTIQRNGVNVQTFTANASANATANITVPTKTSDLTNDSDFVQSTDLANVATSGNYNDLSNKPTIPTVNNATLTIQQNGTDVKTFTANASSNVTCNITVPTKTSDLTNDSNFVPSTDLANVATSGNYNDLSNKPTIPTVNNATLTIQRNGTTLDTFTANASVDKTININTADDTKIPLAGSNAISGSLIPSTDGTVNLGSSSYQWNNAYIKSLTINGTAAGDILTHNASEFVPRSGGAVMTGKQIFRISTNSYLMVGGGTNSNNGAYIQFNGGDYTSAAGYIRIISAASGTFKNMVLMPDGTWTWDGTAVQLISDQRLKQQITEIDDKLLDAWEDVNLVQFKYNDAVDAKKDKARLHTGYVVQQIDNACKSHNVDVSKYGLYCHEVYPEETEEVEVELADGTKTKETKVIREASEHYSLRYTEAYAIECKYLRRCIKQLTTRIERLTARIEQLEKGKGQEAGK